MATRENAPPTLRESIIDCNYRLDCALRRRYGVGLKAYKTIKAVSQLVGILALIQAMQLGMDPGTAGLIIGAILVGPEYVEARLANGEDGTK